jgi:hypothetical protein
MQRQYRNFADFKTSEQYEIVHSSLREFEFGVLFKRGKDKVRKKENESREDDQNNKIN